ncbi:hypothetical protein WL80_06100 [Burkholderia ubonensis]|uniref:SMI1/KNR4 family protein n=1 Tax=Burkholderia ubonensis TaxID=101571 RepID=UPI0007522B26|nr:SMI1/KNR4 family protein [Burkholderia ubonensis]KVO27686.1 hypothetical protein WJ74_26585 [Burkholderia ubonensis]KVU02371.1 hypothetical protein WK62_02150 [Burkholderia ubonensis]KVX91642.1 hypothetical protein WL08_03590 [Burkholderia ubonensis]KWE96186.1 hypothetical protein WL80_06100 [Burkholderia ubonensis]
MFNRIIVRKAASACPTAADVSAAEEKLRTRFPKDYAEYITRFGEGVLGGDFVRIYPPRRILAELEDWRARIDQYWFWDEGRSVLTKDAASRAIVIGDTTVGDELIFHPGSPDRILVLPRESESIFVAGDGLEQAIEWLCTSGELSEPFDERDFEGFA